MRILQIVVLAQSIQPSSGECDTGRNDLFTILCMIVDVNDVFTSLPRAGNQRGIFGKILSELFDLLATDLEEQEGFVLLGESLVGGLPVKSSLYLRKHEVHIALNVIKVRRVWPGGAGVNHGGSVYESLSRDNRTPFEKRQLVERRPRHFVSSRVKEELSKRQCRSQHLALRILKST